MKKPWISIICLILYFACNSVHAKGISPDDVCLENSICVKSRNTQETVGIKLKLSNKRIFNYRDEGIYDCFKDANFNYLIIYSHTGQSPHNVVYLEATTLPIKDCEQLSISNKSNLLVTPFALGVTEEQVIEKIGPPFETWDYKNSNQGLAEDEKALVYTKDAVDLDLVFFVIKNKILIRTWASVMP